MKLSLLKHFQSFIWILILLASQITVAIMGILSAYLQSVPNAPVPALRFTLLMNLVGEATLLVFYLFPSTVKYVKSKQDTQAGEVSKSAARDNQPIEAVHKGQRLNRELGENSPNSSAGALGQSKILTVPNCGESESLSEGSCAEEGSCGAPKEHTHSNFPELSHLDEYQKGTCQQAYPTSVNSQCRKKSDPVRSKGHSNPVDRSFWDAHPVMEKYGLLAILCATFVISAGMQTVAPGFVDPAIVQLVCQFSAVITALVQTFMLGHPLPWTIWPTSALMTGGAIMIIIPSLGHDTTGSLSTGRGWLGFGLECIGVVAGVTYYLTLQFKGKSLFSATYIMFWSVTLGVIVFTVLSLPIDGTAWSEQLGGWSAGDWLLLVFCGVSYVAIGVILELAAMRVGAAMVALTKGLRLVASVVLTKPILGRAAIQSGLQIGGVVLVAVSLTAYVGSLWWFAHKKKDTLPHANNKSGILSKLEHSAHMFNFGHTVHT